MTTWTFYPAFLATVISVVGLMLIVSREHRQDAPRSLSELGAAEQALLRRFGTILWICGTLFAITVYWFIVPRIHNPSLVVAAWSLEYLGNLVAAIIPARGKTFVWHNIFAQLMGVGMLALAYVFWLGLTGIYATVDLGIAIAMSILGILTFIDKRRFIFYEMPFVFLSHISILVAAVAFR